MIFFTKVIGNLRQRWHEPQGYADVLRVSLPLVASLASTTLMQFTDRLFLSHYSVEAIAAAVPAALANLVVLLSFMGIVTYANVFIAQFTGAGLKQRVGATLWQAVYLSLASGILLVFAAACGEALFSLAGHEPEVRRQEVVYYGILTSGGVWALLGASLSCFFSGRGQTRLLMLASFVGVAINIPLDYYLIFGIPALPFLGFEGVAPMGIAGAAYATVTGWIVNLLILAVLTFTPRNERKYRIWSGWRPDFPLLKRMVRFGFPSGANSFMELLTSTIFVFVAGRLGSYALAATNITFSINGVAFLPALGLNIGASVLVGQAMGRNNPDQAEKAAHSSLHIALFYMIVMALVFVTVPGVLMRLFRPAGVDPAAAADIAATGVVLLRYVAFYSIMDAWSLIYFGSLKGAGDTWFVMWAMTGACVCMLAGAYLADRFFPGSLHALWLVFTTVVSGLAGSAALRFYFGPWRKLRLIHKSDARA